MRKRGQAGQPAGVDEMTSHPGFGLAETASHEAGADNARGQAFRGRGRQRGRGCGRK